MDDAGLEEPPSMGDGGLMDTTMDDLFGETNDGLGIHGVMTPAAAIPASLILRIADMQRSGACTKLAWGPWGTSAQISEHGDKISFQTMIRSITDGKWRLSGESKHPLHAPAGKQFVHVQFSGLGIDLAALDNCGGVHMHHCTSTFGRMYLHPGGGSLTDVARTELDALVGLQWLPVYPAEHRTPYTTPATKTKATWSMQGRGPEQPLGRVYHPSDGKNALVSVTCSCRLSLLYQNEGLAWSVVSIELESTYSSEDLLTHAAIGEGEGHLLVVTHDQTRRLRLYKLNINWNTSQQSRGNVVLTTVSPTLEISHLTAAQHVGTQLSDGSRLSGLRIVPPVASVAVQDGSAAVPTTILALYTYATSSTNGTLSQPESSSTIARWSIETVVPTLHEAFMKLRPNASAPVLAAVTVLRRQPDITSHKIFLTADVQYHNTLIAFGASDGTVEFRDRSTWNIIESFAETNVASSLPQSGFQHIPGEHHAHIALNADGSFVAFTKADGTLGTQGMILQYGWQPLEDGISDTKGLLETAVVCLARQFAILCSSHAATDEVLALLPQDLSMEMRNLFMKQVISTICKSLDSSMLDQKRQQQAVAREQFLPRLLGAQLVLHTEPGSTKRQYAGQFAYVYMNIRLISIALVQSLASEKAAAWPGLTSSLIGPVKWASDLMVYIVDSIAHVQRDLQPGASVKQAFEQHTANTGNPAIFLLLCSTSRMLIRMQVLYMTQYYKFVQAAIPRAASIEERQQLMGVYEMAKALPVSYPAFSELITELDGFVRLAYTESGATSERRTEIELAMVTEGLIPNELEPALQKLVHSTLPKIFDTADMGGVYFWRTQWLGIDSAMPLAQGPRYDALRKTRLSAHMKLRVCRRCGAEMEDISPDQTRQLPPWLNQFQKQCFCQGAWWLP